MNKKKCHFDGYLHIVSVAGSQKWLILYIYWPRVSSFPTSTLMVSDSSLLV